MMKKKQPLAGWFAAVGMALLILDAKTALIGAKDGISLCLYTVIPSLFPFFILSVMISSSLTGRSIPLLRPVRKFCGMPEGSESLLLLGLVGGYPIGAQSIYQAYRDGQLQKKDAQRLLGFCNNAGPSFVFGMAACLFTKASAVWVLWIIQILSVIITGFILPERSRSVCKISTCAPVSMPQAINRSIKSMASVCGWVILFRVILAILQRWCLWLLPLETQVLIIGSLELANGCTELVRIDSEGIRFLLCTCFLSLGGICVGMQTVSVCKELGTGMYFPGKVLQAMISFALAYPAYSFLYSQRSVFSVYLLIILIFVLAGIGYARLIRRKKVLAI